MKLGMRAVATHMGVSENTVFRARRQHNGVKTAKAIGLTILQNVLSRADIVIE